MTNKHRLFFVIGLLWAVVALAPSAWADCPAGYPRTTPDSDFTAAGDGMVQHTPTGLIWKRCAEGQTWDGTTCNGLAATYTWQQAFKRADDVNAGVAGTQNLGQTDWRIPNINELISIVEQGCYTPAINLAQFPESPASHFWSASPLAGYSGFAWGVYFDYGNDYWFHRSHAGHVRLVRAGQFFYNFDAALGTVTVTKGLDGTAAASVSPATAFLITLTCGTTTLGPFKATTATPAVFNNVPLGNCTVAEGTLPVIAGVTWGTARYNPDNPITVTAGAPTSVTVTNLANITPYTVTITANPAAGGTVSCTPNPVNHGGEATCTATPNAGYTFSGWSGDCTGTGACTLTNVTSAKSVTASFSQAAVLPTLGGTPPQGVVGQPYSFTPTVTGTPPITFSAIDLPAGLSIDSTTGAITGTPTATGSFTVSITASNNAGTVTQPFTITIAAAPVGGGGQPIPTLSEWALILMSLIMGAFLWRRREE